MLSQGGEFGFLLLTVAAGTYVLARNEADIWRNACSLASRALAISSLRRRSSASRSSISLSRESMVVTSRRVAHPDKDARTRTKRTSVFTHDRIPMNFTIAWSSDRFQRVIKQTANDAGSRTFAV